MAMTQAGTNTNAGSSTRPDASDFLNIDAHLSDEERGVREMVRSFVHEKIKPNIKGWYDEAVFPKEIVPEFADLGLLGMHLSGYGCAGKSAVEYGLACMELEAGDSGLRTFVSVQGSLATIADVVVVWARTDEEKNPVRGFLVPTDTEGFSATDITPKLSMRASIQCDIRLQDVRLPDGAMLPEASVDHSPAWAKPGTASSGARWGLRGTATRPP